LGALPQLQTAILGSTFDPPIARWRTRKLKRSRNSRSLSCVAIVSNTISIDAAFQERDRRRRVRAVTLKSRSLTCVALLPSFFIDCVRMKTRSRSMRLWTSIVSFRFATLRRHYETNIGRISTWTLTFTMYRGK
jgi:hypothetical protein